MIGCLLGVRADQAQCYLSGITQYSTKTQDEWLEEYGFEVMVQLTLNKYLRQSLHTSPEDFITTLKQSPTCSEQLKDSLIPKYLFNQTAINVSFYHCYCASLFMYKYYNV